MLFENYTDMAYNVANKLMQRANAIHYTYEDAQQDALLTLATSIWDYDPSRNTKFSTLLYPRLHKSVSTGINNAYSLKVGNSGKTKLDKGKKIIESWNETNSKGNVEEYLDREAKIKPYQLYNLKNATKPFLSFNSDVSQDVDLKLEEVIADESSEMQYEESLFLEYIEGFYYLSEEEKILLATEMDVLDEVPLFIKEMDLKIYKKRIRDIYKKIRKHMKKYGGIQ